MPDEYGLPTAAEYRAQQAALSEEERKAQQRADISRGADIGGSIIPGLGTVIGAGFGYARSGLRNIITEEDRAEKMRQARLAGLLKKAQLGELVSPEELATIEQKYMDPLLATQRAGQQAALQGVASQDMGAGNFARAQQAEQAYKAEQMLNVTKDIQESQERAENARREELAALVEGDIKAAQAAAAKAGKDAQAAFNQFMASVDPEEMAETEWSKQFMEKLEAKKDLTPAQIEAGQKAKEFWLGLGGGASEESGETSWDLHAGERW